MIATYHNHSTWSDGTSSIAALVERAAALGVQELGISDHFVLHPIGRTPVWSMPPDRVREYAEEVQASSRSPGPVVRLGLEVDWFPGLGDGIREALNGIPFDYLIGSVHEVDGFRIDATPDEWDSISIEEQNEKHRLYWRHLKSLAESGLFDIAAHLDLSKKFGHRPTIDLSQETSAALDAIATAEMVVELNTAGWHKPCEDGYPSLDLLEACHERGIAVTLSSDAHHPDHLLRDFRQGAERLSRAGYQQVARFKQRQRTFEPLDAAVP